MSLHIANLTTAFNRTRILVPNYRWVNWSATSHQMVRSPATNATALAQLRAAAASRMQCVLIYGHKTQIVPRTNRAEAAAAATVSVAGVLVVLPLYFGWWELGRAPSLNPLETGVAMGAPLLLLQRQAPNESCEGGDVDGYSDDSGGQQQQQQPPQRQRRMNSNGGHAHIEARVGALRVSYCAVHVVDEEDVERNDQGPYEDKLTAIVTPRVEGDDAVSASQLQQQQEPNEQPSYADRDVEMFDSGKGMRLRLVDEQQMLRRRIKMVTPRKGYRFF